MFCNADQSGRTGRSDTTASLGNRASATDFPGQMIWSRQIGQNYFLAFRSSLPWGLTYSWNGRGHLIPKTTIDELLRGHQGNIDKIFIIPSTRRFRIKDAPGPRKNPVAKITPTTMNLSTKPINGILSFPMNTNWDNRSDGLHLSLPQPPREHP